MSDAVASRRAVPVVLLTAIVSIMFAGAVALWAHYGTAVFFEMIRSGFVACFG